MFIIKRMRNGRNIEQNNQGSGSDRRSPDAAFHAVEALRSLRGNTSLVLNEMFIKVREAGPVRSCQLDRKLVRAYLALKLNRCALPSCVNESHGRLEGQLSYLVRSSKSSYEACKRM